MVLVERDSPGSGASGVAAGMLVPCGEADGPGPFLDLGRRSLEMWPDMAARLRETTGIDCELQLCGVLRVALEDADVAAVRSAVEWQRAAGIEVGWLDADEVAALEPAAARCSGAAWYAIEGHVDAVRTVAALVAAGRGQGLEVRTATAVVGSADGGRLRLSAGDAIRAAVVVVSAGAWSAEVASALGASCPPVVPVRGQLIALRGLERVPGHVVYAGRRGYAVGRHDGSVIVGATEEAAGFDGSVTAGATERLLATARRLLRDAGAPTAAEARAGLRPRAADGLPLLGELAAGRAGGPRVLVASGHHRNGVLLAPVTGEGMASLVLDGRLPDGWEAFDPRRLIEAPGISPRRPR